MIETLFFDADAHRLFGAFHPPIAAVRNRAVLLAPPLGHEYVQSYFALRTLASTLAARGFPVLRFDYRGCGNSSGDPADATLEQWQADVTRAASVLRDRSGVDAICIGGLRFGATLAALAAADDPAIASVLLWEPVLEGSDYVQQLHAAHRNFLQRLGLAAVAPDSNGQIELLGFPMGADVLRDLNAIGLAQVAHGTRNRHVLLLDGAEAETDEAARRSLAAVAASFAHVHDPAADPWRRDPHHIFLPGNAIREAATWMEMRD